MDLYHPSRIADALGFASVAEYVHLHYQTWQEPADAGPDDLGRSP